MEPGQLAVVAVKITQIIKTNLDATPGEVIQNILKELPELSPEEIIEYFTTFATRKGARYKDVYDIIAQIQYAAKNAIDDLETNSLWQNVAQGLYYVGHIIKGFLPPKWAAVITIVLDTYQTIKEK